MTNSRLGLLVTGLGVGQICSWGTLYYSIAVLGGSIGRDLGIDKPTVFGAFSLGLFVLGCCAPAAGKAVDARGGRLVMSTGSVLAALALFIMSTADGAGVLFLGWSMAGAAMAMTLYDPAFSTLSQHAGPAYRKALTALTLIAGFASTVFWPTSLYLLETMGWRGTLTAFAILHLALCLPIHLFAIPKHRAWPPSFDEPLVAGALNGASRKTYLWLAVAFGLNAVIFSAMSAHLVGLLENKGMTATTAVAVAACIGPMQVAGRIVEMLFGRHWSPIATGFFALSLLFASLALLYFTAGSVGLAFAFAIGYGWSNGILTIVRGTIPTVLLGRDSYGHLLGRLARATYLSQAAAPIAFSLLLAVGTGYEMGILALLAVALATLLAYYLATRRRTVGESSPTCGA